MFAIVGLFPIAFTAVISFQDWDLVRGSGTFIGFDQYIWILNDPKFWTALRNTFSIFVLSTVPQLILAVFIAAMLDRNIRAKTFWRMSVLLPFVMAPVAVALIFSNMFGDVHGLVNNILADFGIDAVQWHKDPFASHVAIATMVNFRWTGYNALILLAAMQAVPREYYEAATVDGAGAFRQFTAITLPSLRPTLIFVIITSTIGGLQIFDEPRMFDNTGQGGAAQQWLTITLYLYNIGWGDFNFGRAAALAWILFIIILVIGLINLLITRRLVRDEGGRGVVTPRRGRKGAKR
jgi:cellobiose transport system permease protein